jgi:hypothetical protein
VYLASLLLAAAAPSARREAPLITNAVTSATHVTIAKRGHIRSNLPGLFISNLL